MHVIMQFDDEQGSVLGHRGDSESGLMPKFDSHV